MGPNDTPLDSGCKMAVGNKQKTRTQEPGPPLSGLEAVLHIQ